MAWGDNNTLRPWEYQWVDDNYAKVVCDELLPEIGRKYNIDPNPAMHAIMGASSESEWLSPYPRLMTSPMTVLMSQCAMQSRARQVSSTYVKSRTCDPVP